MITMFTMIFALTEKRIIEFSFLILVTQSPTIITVLAKILKILNSSISYFLKR